MFENAREYLARVVPWPQPGEPGFVNLHWTFPPTTPRPDGKPAWTGRAVTSAAEAAKTLEFALKSGSNTLDVYACMSTQLNAEPKVSKGKRPFSYNAPIRLATNAIALKSFFIDIDYGKLTKDGQPDPASYATAEEAIVELMKFVGTVGLPKPTMVVSTGGGFHAYWCVSSALTPDRWLPIAFALAEAAKAHGLKCDTQCTVDSVRVLRIPDTFNRKKDPPRAVRFIGPRLDFDYSLDRISAPLAPYMGRVPAGASPSSVDRTLFPLRTYPAVASELQAGLDSLWPSPDLDLVAVACGFVRDAIATGGAGLNNPLWNITTLISTFTKGGRADAHRMGDKHATYSKESTDEFYDRKDRERNERGLGWPACSTISATGAAACKSCAFFAQGKSPLNFEVRSTPIGGAGLGSNTPQANQGTPSSAAPAQVGGFGATQPVGQQFTTAPTSIASQPSTSGLLVTSQGNTDLPSGYLRDAQGIVSAVMVDPNNPSAQVLRAISDYPMMNAWLQADPRVLHFDSTVDRNRVGQIDLPLEWIGTNEMRKILQGQGFMLTSNDKSAGDFFVSWVKKLQQIKDSVASAPFGWQDKNGQTEGFIYGGQLWTPNGSSPSATANPVINQQYKPKGSDAYWLDAVKLVTSQGRPDLEAIVASAFAAPLVMSTGHLGMLMSAYSKESGIGKSTALRIAQAVWGDPIRAVQSLSDTQNSVMAKIGMVRSLPIYWDELKTDEDTKKFVNMTFQIAQGKEKSRLNQRAEMKEPGHWQTLVVSASNDSLLDHITQQTQTTLAGLYRIFEYTVVPAGPSSVGRIDTSEATIRLSKLNTNYGAVGLKYAQWLGSNFAQIELDMAALSKQLNIETGAQQEERFWISLIACILLGARYANTLGYAVFDEPQLKEFMLSSLATMRKLRGQQTVDLTKSINVSSIMASFLKDMQKDNKVLWTDRIHVAPGRPPAANSPHAVKIIKPTDASRLNGIVVQVGMTDKLMRISSAAFGEWLKKSGKSRHLLMEALHASMTTNQVIGFLGGGTGLAFTKENIIQIDLSSSNELNFVDEIQ